MVLIIDKGMARRAKNNGTCDQTALELVAEEIGHVVQGDAD